MGEEAFKSLSKFISLILRHKPETIGVELDQNGYIDVDTLIRGIKAKGYHIDKAILDTIVSTDNKQRYSYSEDSSKIRANQGHSINVDLSLKAIKPPDILYHGSSKRFFNEIAINGIKKMSRTYVHLSATLDTALTVAKRHGKPIVYEIDAKKMYEDGYKFYLSENNVWLTDYVPSDYIVVM